MRGRLVVYVCVFCVAVFAASGAIADKPSKPPKPPKPEVSKAECIVFTGDLQSVEGGTVIEGCCPNAGPWPGYTMTLATGSLMGGTHVGQLFINFFGTGPNAQYIVQFWTWDSDNETPGDGDYQFEIYGGVLERDRKAKTLRVIFDGSEPATVWEYHEGYPETPESEFQVFGVSFELFRASDLSYCE